MHLCPYYANLELSNMVTKWKLITSIVKLQLSAKIFSGVGLATAIN
jgi:hypothetical protein